jgi:hypothetical protein
MSILDYIKIIETKAPQLHDAVLIKVQGQDYTLIFHDLKTKIYISCEWDISVN